MIPSANWRWYSSCFIGLPPRGRADPAPASRISSSVPTSSGKRPYCFGQRGRHLEGLAAVPRELAVEVVERLDADDLLVAFHGLTLLFCLFFIVLPPDRLGEPAIGSRVVAPDTSSASSTKRRPPRRVMWTTSEMPSTTPLQVTSQGSAPPACMAQLARRESAERALLACTVVSDPPWPVFSACSRSAASPPLTSPTTMWSGRWRSAWRTRSRIDTGVPRTRRFPPRSAGSSSRSILSSSVSSMATIRSSSGRSSIRAFSSVVLPEPVPPETRMFRRDRSASRATRNTFSGRAPWPHEVGG